MTESGLCAVLEIVTDSVVAADAEGRIVWLNPSAQRLLGPPSGDLVGTPLESLTAVRAARTVEVEAGRVRSVAVFPPSGDDGSAREVAHDFNNVLSVVQTYTSFVLESAGAGGDDERWAGVRRDAETVLDAVAEGVELCRRLVEREHR